MKWFLLKLFSLFVEKSLSLYLLWCLCPLLTPLTKKKWKYLSALVSVSLSPSLRIFFSALESAHILSLSVSLSVPMSVSLFPCLFLSLCLSLSLRVSLCSKTHYSFHFAPRQRCNSVIWLRFIALSLSLTVPAAFYSMSPSLLLTLQQQQQQQQQPERQNPFEFRVTESMAVAAATARRYVGFVLRWRPPLPYGPWNDDGKRRNRITGWHQYDKTPSLTPTTHCCISSALILGEEGSVLLAIVKILHWVLTYRASSGIRWRCRVLPGATGGIIPSSFSYLLKFGVFRLWNKRGYGAV